MTEVTTQQPRPSSNREAVLVNPWLTAGRVFWLITVAAALFSLISLASRGGRMLLAEPIVEDGYAALVGLITYTSYARLILAFRYLVIGIFFATGLFIFWRKSNTVMGLVASLEVILLPLMAGLGGRAAVFPDTLGLTFQSIIPLVDSYLYAVWFVVTILFIGLFPNGHLNGRWFVIAGAVLIAYVSLAIIAPSLPDWDDSAVWVIAIIGFFGVLVLSIGSAAYRYFRVSGPIEKQQTRWVMASLVLVALWSSLVAGADPFRSWDSRAAPFALFQLFGTVVVAALVPLSIAAAITRYHLWDIDVVIRRTMVYTLLTGTLIAIYLVSILVLQRVFSLLTGQDSTLATILSTLLIAALFLPLRRRIQDGIDRRFFRRKYDAAKVLEDFAATARDETDLDKLTAELLRVIQETMQPEHVSIWLRQEPSSNNPTTGDGSAAFTFRGYQAKPPADQP